MPSPRKLPIYNKPASAETKSSLSAWNSLESKHCFSFILMPLNLHSRLHSYTSYNQHSINTAFTFRNGKYLVPKLLAPGPAQMMLWTMGYENAEAKEHENAFLGDWEGTYCVWKRTHEFYVMRVEKGGDGLWRYQDVPQPRDKPNGAYAEWWWQAEMMHIRDNLLRSAS